MACLPSVFVWVGVLAGSTGKGKRSKINEGRHCIEGLGTKLSSLYPFGKLHSCLIVINTLNY